MKTVRRSLGVAVLAALLLQLPSAADAQRYYRAEPRRGPAYQPERIHGYFGARAIGLFVLSQSTGYATGYLGHGGGFGLFGGIRFSPMFSLEGNWSTTWHDETLPTFAGDVRLLDNIYVMSFTADLKVTLPGMGLIEPFFQVGVGWAYVGAEYSPGFDFDHIFASGPTFNIGGGVDIWLARWFTVGGRLGYRGTYFGEPSYSGLGPRHTDYVNGLMLDINGAIRF